MCIGSERVEEGAYDLVEVLFFSEEVKEFDASFVFFFHDEGSSIDKDFEFLDDFHVDIEGRATLQGVSSTIKIANLNFKFSDLVEGFGSGFF